MAWDLQCMYGGRLEYFGVKWVMVIENECWIFARMLDKNDTGEVNSVSGQILSYLLRKW